MTARKRHLHFSREGEKKKKLKAREEKERGFIRGNSFPLILRKTFSLPQLVFVFFMFFVFGGYKGVFFPLIVIVMDFAVNYIMKQNLNRSMKDGI